MKTQIHTSILAALLCVAFTAELTAQTTAFTYQGALRQSGETVEGPGDFTVSLWNAQMAGNQVGSTATLLAQPVTDGLFTLKLDFGAGAFNGSPRWIQISVRHPAGSGSYTPLAPRQEITPTPVAHFALAGNAGPVGPAGPQGLQGLQGPTGLQGPAGNSHWTLFGAGLYNTNLFVGIGTVPHGGARLEIDGRLGQSAIIAKSAYVAPTITVENFSTGSALHLYSVNEATWWNGGAIQIGLMEQSNLGIDRNEIIARYGGAPSPLYLNYDLAQPTGPVVTGSDLQVNGFGKFATNVGIGYGTADPLSKLSINSGPNEAHAIALVSNHPVFPAIYARNPANGPILWAESFQDATLSGGGGAIVVGHLNGTNLAIDKNSIMARNDQAPATLHLNEGGGAVRMGQHGIQPALAYGKLDGDVVVYISQSPNLLGVTRTDYEIFTLYEITVEGGFHATDIPLVTLASYQIGGVSYGAVVKGSVLEVYFSEDREPFHPDFSFVVYRP